MPLSWPGKLDHRDRPIATVSVALIAAVQNEFSASHKVADVSRSPFGGSGRADQMGSQYTTFGEVGAARERSARRASLAWRLAHGSKVIPIPGSTRPETVVDAMAAIDLRLGIEQLQPLDATVGEGTSQYPDDPPDPPPLRSMRHSPIGRFATDSRRVVVMSDVTIYHNQH
ncbi:MAG: diketogulonate reductase-like aldo/keto reductase [Ilumatobacter sp.]|jgi:diketogulonate reductase-like aldo/keto reductase